MPDHKIFNERPESQDRMIKMFQKMGYEYISRAEAEEKRGSKTRVLFEDEIQNFLQKQTFPYKGKKLPFSSGSIGKAIREIDLPINNGLAMTNKMIYDLICTGKSLEQTLLDGSMQSFDIKYIDFEHLDNNIWQVTDEFEIERSNGKFVRPDIVLMINGIPLIIIECKKSSIDVMEGVKQNIRNWQPDYIPNLFKFSQVVIAANPNKILYGTCGTSSKYYTFWREENKRWQEDMCRLYSPDGQVTEQDKAVVSLLTKKRLLDIIYNFIIYDNNVKKITRYKQFFAVHKCMDRIKLKDGKNTRNGVIWHTQGTGKTIIMIMLAKMIQRDKEIINPRFIMVTDRKNLDKQIRDNFINTNMRPVRAATGKGLVNLIKDEGNSVITTVVNKFEIAISRNFKNESENIFLMIDEGHRTHYGKLNTYMRTVLPNAAKIAFTGTPLIKSKKKSTYEKFGPIIDSYKLEDAINDNVTVPLVYEGRVIPQKVTSKKINDHLKYITASLNREQTDDLKQKWSRFVPLAQTKQRVDMVAFNLYEHFIKYCKPKKFKAIITCSSRAFAIDLYYKLKPLEGINPAVVITPENILEGEDDDTSTQSLKKIANFFKKEIDPLYNNNYEAYEDYARNTFIDPEGDIDLLIVKDKLLTGFDAPVAAVLYIDKPMKDHSVLQAIARVNRLYENKDFGLIVDYYGVFKKLNEALDLYSDDKTGFDKFDEEDIKNIIFGPADEKRKLAESQQKLWDIFTGITKDETRSNIWQEALENIDKRKDFYEKLSVYSKLVDLMFSSYEFFNLVGLKESEIYKHDLIHFNKLRAAVSLRYNDSVDFSKYEDGIKELLDSYVQAADAHIVVEPLYILDKDKMLNQLEKLGSNNAKADAIKTRIAAEIDTKQYDDPIMFLEFSERINETLEEYMTDRNSDAYYNSMERMAEDFREGRTAYNYPASIENDNDAKSFYGAMSKVLKNKKEIETNIEMEEKLATLSIKIKETVVANAKRDWRDNVIVNRKIVSELDDVIFDFIEENGLKMSVDMIDLLLDEFMMVAKKRF